jgi:hypothetical protein
MELAREQYHGILTGCLPFFGIAVSAITSTASLPPTNWPRPD